MRRRDFIAGAAGAVAAASLVGHAQTQSKLPVIGFLGIAAGYNHVSDVEALRLGLVNRVVPAASLMQEARSLATELAARPPIAARYIIEAVNRGLEVSFDKGAFLEATLFGLVASTDDMREGTRAFLEKRKADFKGN